MLRFKGPIFFGSEEKFKTVYVSLRIQFSHSLIDTQTRIHTRSHTTVFISCFVRLRASRVPSSLMVRLSTSWMPQECTQLKRFGFSVRFHCFVNVRGFLIVLIALLLL